MKFGDKVQIASHNGYMSSNRRAVLGLTGLVIGQDESGVLSVAFEVPQNEAFKYQVVFIREMELAKPEPPKPPTAQVDAFTQYAQKLADEVGVELMDVYTDGGQDGFVEDDGFLHYTKDGLRAGFDVGNGLAPTQERANIKAIKKAISASGWSM